MANELLGHHLAVEHGDDDSGSAEAKAGDDYADIEDGERVSIDNSLDESTYSEDERSQHQRLLATNLLC